MNTIASNNKSLKSQKNIELKKSKTQAMLFFLTCLDEAVDINQLEEFSSLQYLSFDEQQKLIQACKNLPHPDLMFYQTINTYRGAKILKMLDENINPVYLKKFTKNSNLEEKNSKENKIECQLILKMIDSNRQDYRDVLQLFIDSFEKNVREKWEKNEPDLLEQHLEKQNKLFAQKNAIAKKIDIPKVKKSMLPRTSVSEKEVIKPNQSEPNSKQNLQQTIPLNDTKSSQLLDGSSSKNLPISAVATEQNIDPISNENLKINSMPKAVKQDTSDPVNSIKILPETESASAENSTNPQESVEYSDENSVIKEDKTDIYEIARKAVERAPKLSAMLDISGW